MLAMGWELGCKPHRWYRPRGIHTITCGTFGGFPNLRAWVAVSVRRVPCLAFHDVRRRPRKARSVYIHLALSLVVCVVFVTVTSALNVVTFFSAPGSLPGTTLLLFV